MLVQCHAGPMPEKDAAKTGSAGGCQNTQKAAGGHEGTCRGLPNGPYKLICIPIQAVPTAS